jgi:hypothetical protein
MVLARESRIHQAFAAAPLAPGLSDRGNRMQARTAAPMTRSPLALARTAFSVAKQALPPYSSKYSRQDFTQHQLVAILVLRQFFRTDLRSMIEWLSDFRELRETLEPKKVPHYSTLSYAERRLLKKTPSFFSRRPSFGKPTKRR